MNYAYYYTKTSHSIDDVIEVKQDVLSDLFELVIKYSMLFKDNPNLNSSLIYAYKYIMNVLTDLNYEHDIYIYIMDYLANIDDVNDVDNNTLLSIDQVLYELEDDIEKRIFQYASFLAHYDQIFEDRILTNVNYFYPPYEYVISENEKNKLLSKLPQKK